MSSTLRVTGIVPRDDRYDEMRAVYDACIKARVDVPDEVANFFGYSKPLDQGTEIGFNSAADIPIFHSIDKYGEYDKLINLKELHERYPGVMLLRIRYGD
jgi:hypothetical protein